ncbi:hypothetical protein SAMN04488128_105133 [Chitinophaga eiseniae]|uniref:Uncharacterized protein n=1 Tax=Chitinophaga eiseniae TaxID=634771 RepID=A0A1T4TI85_9BACT|nr:hypothetical protein SAMN04488128_105133 [Chitinophaga eiseniae]
MLFLKINTIASFGLFALTQVSSNISAINIFILYFSFDLNKNPITQFFPIATLQRLS